MTCIIGVTDGDNVWMGSDTCAGNSDYILSIKHPKIIRKNIGDTDMLIGVSGELRGHWIVDNMDFPEYPKDCSLERYVTSLLIDKMRTEFREQGYSKLLDSKEDQDCHFLVALKGRIFSIWDSFGVIESADNYWAIGSGMYLALGSLHATNLMDIKPKKRVEMALEAAAYHTPYVDLPLHIEKI